LFQHRRRDGSGNEHQQPDADEVSGTIHGVLLDSSVGWPDLIQHGRKFGSVDMIHT
jgi:hypothetical protein